MNNMPYRHVWQTPKFFFLNWYLLIPAMVTTIHFRIWTVLLCISIMTGVSILDYMKMSPAMLLRKIRFICSFSTSKRIRTRRRIKNAEF